MIDWTNADYADGPSIAKWLLSQHRPHPTHSAYESVMATARRWLKGARAEFDSVDRHLTALGIHVSEVPDECWRRGSSRSKPVNWELRRAALAAVEELGGIKPAARKLGMSPKTIRRWVKEPA